MTAPLLAIDLEMTGLDPSTDAIVSIGWVPIDQGAIDLGGASEVGLAADTSRSVGHSATIHGIRDCDRVGGETFRPQSPEQQRRASQLALAALYNSESEDEANKLAEKMGKRDTHEEMVLAIERRGKQFAAHFLLMAYAAFLVL